MALVAGVNIPDNKRVEIALQTVYGVGPAVAKRVVADSALDGNPRVRELSEEELNRVRGALDQSGAIIEGDLRREVQMNVLSYLLTSPVAGSPTGSSRPVGE